MKFFENYLAVKKISKCKEMFMPWNRIHFSLTEPGSGSIFPWRNQDPDPFFLDGNSVRIRIKMKCILSIVQKSYNFDK